MSLIPKEIVEEIESRLAEDPLANDEDIEIEKEAYLALQKFDFGAAEPHRSNILNSMPDWCKAWDSRLEYVSDEVAAFIAIQEFDFGAAEHQRDKILANAMELEFNESWEDRLRYIRAEAKACQEIIGLSADELAPDTLERLKMEAAEDDGVYDFESELGFLRSKIDQLRNIRRTRAKVEPIRELLERMEKIIGSECYNGHIQNYGPGGVWEGEGRSFRYPVRFVRHDEREGFAHRKSLEAEELVTGYYKFGANELSIYRALVHVVDMLEAEYGLKIDRTTRP